MTSTCAAVGCGASCQRGMLMCKACWYSVPAKLRKAVSAAWRQYLRAKGYDETFEAIKTYRAARDAAITAAAEARP